MHHVVWSRRMDSLRHIRTRWAAVGAAVAITLGAGGLGVANATLDSGERTSFVPITPCRLLDTRSGVDNVGPRSTPIGPGEELVVAARGAQGDCNLPAGATGIVANVTAVGATSQTNVRLYPAGAATPTTSNLNPTPGERPTPNSVTTDLDDDGEFAIFNSRGTVDLFVDVVGYYEDHNHDDRYEVVPDRFVIAPGDFNPTFSAIPTERGGTLSTTIGFACFVAPVDLPDGTTISSVTAAVSVANAGDNFTVQLGRHTFADGQDALTASSGDIASALSGPVSPGGVVTHLTDDTVMSPVVDNATALYTASICMNAPGGQIFAYIIDTE